MIIISLHQVINFIIWLIDKQIILVRIILLTKYQPTRLIKILFKDRLHSAIFVAKTWYYSLYNTFRFPGLDERTMVVSVLLRTSVRSILKFIVREVWSTREWMLCSVVVNESFIGNGWSKSSLLKYCWLILNLLCFNEMILHLLIIFFAMHLSSKMIRCTEDTRKMQYHLIKYVCQTPSVILWFSSLHRRCIAQSIIIDDRRTWCIVWSSSLHLVINSLIVHRRCNIFFAMHRRCTKDARKMHERRWLDAKPLGDHHPLINLVNHPLHQRWTRCIFDA